MLALFLLGPGVGLALSLGLSCVAVAARLFTRSTTAAESARSNR